ncbi:MAG TPA: LLM class flavin-dependent oxidoreductase [Bryobacteraceae bacterium]|nr:LLM class flavin-dependent oxidoreductase [Bryobacteraceae bacterium]
MKFGVFDHIDDGGVSLGEHFENRLRLVEAYERAGFYAYHVAEHHGTPLGFAPSPGVFLSAVAQRTKRIRFGPLVYILPLYHPLRLIEEISMLDHLSGGRFQLGVGRGVSPIELGFYGADPAQTAEQYREALAVILRGLGSDVLTHHGKFYHFESVPMVLRPLQRPHPPLWYGVGNAETTVWAAAQYANIVTLRTAEGARQITDRYRAEWKKLGNAEAKLPFLGLSRHIVLAETEAEARRIAARAYRPWRRNMELLWKAHGVPFTLPLPDEFEPYARAGGAFAGTPGQARQFVREQVEVAGANYFVCDIAFGDISYAEAERTARLFADEVMPAFAGASATSGT